MNSRTKYVDGGKFLHLSTVWVGKSKVKGAAAHELLCCTAARNKCLGCVVVWWVWWCGCGVGLDVGGCVCFPVWFLSTPCSCCDGLLY